MLYLGVDLGGTNIKAALVSENGEIVKEAAVPTNLPRTAQAVCDDIAALCLQLTTCKPKPGCLSALATTPMWLPSAKRWRAAPKGRRVR